MGDGSSSSFKSHIPDLNQKVLTKEHLASKCMSTGWTDEKHGLYLKSMEASFVEDLYNSFDLFGYQIKLPSDSRLPKQKRIGSRISSGQKINFKRNSEQTVKADGHPVLSANPWIRHYRSSRGREIAASSTHYQKNVLAADLSSYDSVEVTDQNFAEEEDIGEIANHKKIKIEISMDHIQINDQVVVVPLSEFPGPMDVVDKSTEQY